MKKLLTLLMVTLISISMVACGEGATPEETSATETTVTETAENTELTKDEMLSSSQALTRDEIDKSIENVAFAKNLVGNVYSFDGTVESINEDCAVITFYVKDGDSNYATSEFVMVADLYLTSDELMVIESEQRLSFVGELSDVYSREENIPDWGTETIVTMVFKNAAVVSDRFEKTGTLDSPNPSYGENAWNIEFPNNSYLSVVHFKDDVSSYKGKEITYSYKITGEGCVEAYIVE